ncbi:MAG TPA: nucleoside hydrolase [Phycisphaerae bacterium]|nr:nucleoside hydrolase [Phycisphaerae bacterium]
MPPDERPAPVPIIIDTDIGEDIDDLLVLCFALNSPEFEVVGVTTVDGDTDARSRIARRVTAAYRRPATPVVAGYYRSMPQANEPWPALTAVTQNDVAPTEEGLPPRCETPADELIARLAAERPGEVYVLTIGSLTNVGQALVRFPETARNLAGIVTNGGNFGPDRETRIGWNLRYDPVASATVARSEARWVLIPEGMKNLGGLSAEDVEAIRTRGLETTDVIFTAIQGWRANKREVKPDSTPHLSDLRVFAHLLGGIIETVPGRAFVTVGPRGTVAELRVERDDEGPHTLGWTAGAQAGADLHDLFMKRILAEPIATKEV